MIKKLNLGCGKNYREGYTNLDSNKMIKADIYADIEKKLPFKNNYFDEVSASHILEHIHNFIELMEELYRICKNGAIIRINCPYFASVSAFQDPTHTRFFTLKTFNYFLPDNYNNFITKARFKIIKKKVKITRKNWMVNLPIEFLINHLQWFYERFFCFIIPFQEIYYELKVLKQKI